MKIVKIIILVVLILVIVIGYLQYPKLNIISGYAAKNMATNVFYANRPIDSINKFDNNVPSIKLAKTNVDLDKKMTTSTVLGMMPRKVFYREGLGAVVIDDNFHTQQNFLVPKRTKINNELVFPYGDKDPKDSIFTNIDYTALHKGITNAFSENHLPDEKKTRAVLVIHKDKIIAEKYATGFDKNSKFLGWSMAKSLLASVFGALEKEHNFDIHKPVISSLKTTGWENDDRAQITTHHLLKMVSGLDWEEDYTKISDVTKMLFLERDMTKLQAQKKASHKPGSNFIYSSGTTNLLSGVLRAQFKTHQEYLDFPYTALIDKIGMNSMLFETDMEGNYVGSSYAWATARDWAKFGLLYLHEGNWNGEQVFNKSWSAYTVKSAMMEMNMVAEGYYAVKSAYEIKEKNEANTPIIDAVYNIVYLKRSPKRQFKLLTELLD